MKQSGTGFGDLLRAWSRLMPDDPETGYEIARLLGLIRPVQSEIASTTPKSQPASAPLPKLDKTTDQPETEQTPDDAARTPLAFTLQSQGKAADADKKPPWYTEVRPWETRKSADQPPLTALLPPQWTRTVLSDHLAVEAPDGDLDMPRIVDHLARRKPLHDLPREMIPTLRGGVQVLVDAGASMMLYERDQNEILSALDRLFPPDKCRVQFFRGIPHRYGVTDRATRRSGPYTLPAPGTTILLLTDFGLGQATLLSGGVPPDEWVEFARIAAVEGCPVVGLCPFMPARVPPEIRQMMTVIPWDRPRTPPPPLPGPTLSDEATRFEHQVRDFQAALPFAYELAKRASLAVRIEPELLRRLRVQLLPYADAGTESDLWYSTLVESQSSRAMILRPEIRAILRQHLRDDDDLQAVWQVLEDFRQMTQAPLSVLVEEQIVYKALSGAVAVSDAAIQALLRETLSTVLQHGTQDRGLLRWALRAMPAVNDVVPSLDAKRLVAQIEMAAGLRVPARRTQMSTPLPLSDVTWLLPDDLRQNFVPVGVQVFDQTLEFSDPPAEGSEKILLPPTNPRVIECLTPGVDEPRVISIPANSTQPAPYTPDTRLRIITGEEFALIPAATEAAPSTAPAPESHRAPDQAGHIFISYTRRDTTFVRPLVNALEEAGFSVWFDAAEIPGAEDWREQANRAIREAAAMVVIVSEATRDYENGPPDVLYANGWDVPVIPIRIDDVPVPLSLIDKHYVDFRGDFERAMDDLIGLLRATVERTPAAPPFPDEVNEQTFFAYLAQLPDGERLVDVAQMLYKFAHQVADSVAFDGGNAPHFTAQVAIAADDVTVFHVMAYVRNPRLEISLNLLAENPLLASSSLQAERTRLFERLNEILPPNDRLDPEGVGNPSIPLEVLARDESILEGVEAVLADFIDRLGRLSEQGDLPYIEDMPPLVFYSYRREDREFAQRISEGLERVGFSSWIDTQALTGAEDFAREIERVIQQANVLLVILSPESQESEWVRREVNMADAFGTPIVVAQIAEGNIATNFYDYPYVSFVDRPFDEALTDLIQRVREVASNRGYQQSQQTYQTEYQPESEVEVESDTERRDAVQAQLESLGWNTDPFTLVPDYGELRLQYEVATIASVSIQPVDSTEDIEQTVSFGGRGRGLDIIFVTDGRKQVRLNPATGEIQRIDAFPTAQSILDTIMQPVVYVIGADSWEESAARPVTGRSGPGTQFSFNFSIVAFDRPFSLMDVQPNPQNPGELWFKIQFDDTSETWLPPDFVEVRGDLTRFGYGVVLRPTRPPDLTRQEPPTQQKEQSVPPTPEDTSPYQRIYLIYSRRDQDVARAIKQMQRTLGNDVFVDEGALRAGESWEEALRQQIDEADIVQIMWSQALADEWDRWRPEIEYILKSGKDIRPVAVEDPMPLVPPELEHLHFQRVTLSDDITAEGDAQQTQQTTPDEAPIIPQPPVMASGAFPFADSDTDRVRELAFSITAIWEGTTPEDASGIWSYVRETQIAPRKLHLPLTWALLFDVAVLFGRNHGLIRQAEQTLGLPQRSMPREEGSNEEQLITVVAQIFQQALNRQAEDRNLPGLRARGDFWMRLVTSGDWYLRGDDRGFIDVNGSSVINTNPDDDLPM